MKRTLLAALIMLCMFLSACGSGFDLTSYKGQAAEINEKITDSATQVSNLAKSEKAYWESYEKISGGKNNDFEQVLESGKNILLEKGGVEFSDIEAGYAEVGSLYKEIVAVNVSGAEGEKIKSTVDELYDAYNSLYLLATEPSGSLSNFISNHNEYVDTIKSASSTLSLLTE